MPRSIRNALTIDLEDWYHPEYVADKVNPDSITPMIEESTKRTLNLLDELHIKSTFFVNGQIVENYPHLIYDIEQQGHEIASHGYSHTPLWKMTPKDFVKEISLSNTAIQKAIGKKPIGFRAPSFSLTNNTSWALKILKESGYLYDSSIFPLKTPLYGVRRALTHPYRPALDNLCKENGEGTLIEFPLLTTSVLGIKLPASGGFYFRIMPTSIIKHAVVTTNRNGYPAMMYFHPWELIGNTPLIRLLPHRFFVFYANLKRTEKQIRALAYLFKFATVREILGF